MGRRVIIEIDCRKKTAAMRMVLEAVAGKLLEQWKYSQNCGIIASFGYYK